MAIKRTYLIQDISGRMLLNDMTGEPQEFGNEKVALKAAKDHLSRISGDEVWVFRLSHVVSRPDIEPDVEEVP